MIKLVSLVLISILASVSFAQKTKKIEIINANTLEYDEDILGKDVKKLSGNVIFKHDEVLIYCDSAYFYSSQNNFDAFSNVHINKDGTIHLYSDLLKYQGNIKLAEVRDNVKLIDNEMTLTTEFLDFNLKDDIFYYYNGGKIIDSENNLKSKQGYYYSETKEYFFKDSVVLINPDYTMFSDTLRYNTVTEIAYFFGPTKIIKDSNFIYCENGWYNTISDISQYNKNAYLKNKEQILKGDSLYYDRGQGLGKAFSNVELVDSVENIILKGNYGVYYEQPERSMLTGDALFISITDGDSLFLHADTLNSKYDTSGTYKILKAFNKVKLFKSNLQGKCDSLVYSFKDSVIQMHNEPILWSDENQITAEYIEIHTKNNKIDYLEIQNYAFIISQEDTIHFNQIKGKDMVAYFKDEELYKIDVNGNSQSIYFPKDQEDLIGVNISESSDMVIYIKDSEIDKILFITNPDAALYPLDHLPKKDLELKDFQWLEHYRPKDKQDVFIWLAP